MTTKTRFGIWAGAMKSNVSPGQPGSGDFAPYEPDRVRPLMRAIKGELEALQGREIPYEELASYAGQARSSVFDKLQRAEQPQVEALLRWIERLPESVRIRLINSACRCCPTLDSPRLNHDPAQVSRLKTLLRQANGLTVIQGGTEGLRTFLVTAMGHTCTMLEPERRRVCGIDAHEPDWFVPVEDVTYLHNMLDPVRLRESTRKAWPILAEMRSRLTILNGVWPAVRELREEMNQLALRRHLLLSDETRFRPEDLLQRGITPTHLLTVIEEKENRIRVTIQRF
jgi:hypothetical protein